MIEQSKDPSSVKLSKSYIMPAHELAIMAIVQQKILHLPYQVSTTTCVVKPLCSLALITQQKVKVISK